MPECKTYWATAHKTQRPQLKLSIIYWELPRFCSGYWGSSYNIYCRNKLPINILWTILYTESLWENIKIYWKQFCEQPDSLCRWMLDKIRSYDIYHQGCWWPVDTQNNTKRCFAFSCKPILPRCFSDTASLDGRACSQLPTHISLLYCQ